MAQAVGKKSEESIFAGAFSSFSVKDLDKAKQFYGETLGVSVTEMPEGLRLEVKDSGPVFLYSKDDHRPATFTVFNFKVDDIENAVDELTGRGISFESYEGEMNTDKKGIFRGKDNGHGPNIAWFKDPDGNFLSIIED